MHQLKLPYPGLDIGWNEALKEYMEVEECIRKKSMTLALKSNEEKMSLFFQLVFVCIIYFRSRLKSY